MSMRSPDVELDNRIRVAWLILADHAEVVADKLYLVGGGWDSLIIQPQAQKQHLLSFAVAIRVPWSETNRRHQIQIEIQDEDGSQLAKVDGYFEVGRPVGISPGQAQRFQMAINHIPLPFEKAGVYTIVPRINGEDDQHGRTNFTVIHAQR